MMVFFFYTNCQHRCLTSQHLCPPKHTCHTARKKTNTAWPRQVSAETQPQVSSQFRRPLVVTASTPACIHPPISPNSLLAKGPKGQRRGEKVQANISLAWSGSGVTILQPLSSIFHPYSPVADQSSILYSIDSYPFLVLTLGRFVLGIP